jgi:hypothetical protein
MVSSGKFTASERIPPPPCLLEYKQDVNLLPIEMRGRGIQVEWSS